ncbi:hypothetical protein L1049_000139 [Liquidambar formosana]|uniref:PB1 domain-containing protein n=1 Tax=Liquidambar formosana TaxID=63359 RepID=A0AAP0N8E5_LIQFO
MPRGKLILICQSGGKFVTNDDGSLSYTGGEAHAVDINHETLFDDLKLKLAEMGNLEYKTLSIKYFLPGNRRTLITLSNDKDLKRMIDFHGDSVTADVFVMGREGFNRDALNIHASRTSAIKQAETVNRIAMSATAATASRTYGTVPKSAPADSVIAIDATAQSPTTVAVTSDPSPTHTTTDDPSSATTTPTKPVAVAADTTAHSPIVMDMNSTPADTVKKRRRTPSWKIGANGPTIGAVRDNVGEKRRTLSRKRNIRSHNSVAVSDDVEHQQDIEPCETDIKTISTLACSDDVSLEKLVALWKDGITGVGQDFKSVYEFRDALQKYAIAHRFVYRLKKNDSNRASGKCVAEGCTWRIHASWVPSAQSFRIKKMNDSHTCGGESWKSAHPTKNWLVSIIKDRLRDTPHNKPKEIAKGILRDFGIKLNYTQVWRGIEDAREQLQGSV